MNYTYIEYDGQQVRQYEDGTLRRDNGTLVKKPDFLAIHSFTPELAQKAHETRKKRILEAIEQGVMRVTEAPNPAEAIGRIIEKRARVAMNDEGRAGNEASKIVLLALDALQDKKQETIQTQRHEYTMDADTLRIVEAMVRARRDGATIEADTIADGKITE